MNKITSILKKAGKLLKKQYYKGSRFTEKERYHLLSETDMEMHFFLKKHLGIQFPGFTIRSEEEESVEPAGSPCENHIIIDPIDGTTNFITGNPYFTISVAMEKENEIIEAHVYNPLSDEYYYADKKTGKSYYNGKVLNIPLPMTIEDSIIVVGLSYNPDKMDEYVQAWKCLLDSCRKCLFWVAPAQTICNVAGGKVSMFIDMGSSMYGQSAASLILKNAGGRMFNYDMSAWDHRKKGGVFMSGGIDPDKVINRYTT